MIIIQKGITQLTNGYKQWIQAQINAHCERQAKTQHHVKNLVDHHNWKILIIHAILSDIVQFLAVLLNLQILKKILAFPIFNRYLLSTTLCSGISLTVNY